MILAISLIFLLWIGGVYFIKQMEKTDKEEYITKLQSLPVEEKKLYIMKLQHKLTKHQTNHILHFLLSIVTFGIWIVPWALVTHINYYERKNITEQIERI